MEENIYTMNILSQFPNVKLSYEKIVHKKVYDASLCLIIPEGPKYFAWFTKNKCILLWISEGKVIHSFQEYNTETTTFDRDTVLYGTLLSLEGRQWFHTEDILYYKGQFTDTVSLETKWKWIRDIFVLHCHSMCKDISFCVPYMSTSFEEIRKKIIHLLYPVRFIQFRRINDRRTLYHLPVVDLDHSIVSLVQKGSPSSFGQLAVFTVKPDIQNDIYHLLLDENKCKRIACIPDYKTSVMMNCLFRNIKENQRLDALEESDDEEEFENNDVDKYVYLDRSYLMICRYHRKFGKWIPLRVAKPEDKILSEHEIQQIEQNKIYR